MGITAKSKTKTSDNWPGMSFLLIFFPAEDHQPTTTTNLATLKRTNSHSNPILTKAQSTISICVLFLFLTLLLFTLSTFEPTTTASASPPRRFLSYKKPPNSTEPTSFWFLKTKSYNKPNQLPLFALQGLGKLHMRGTRAMADLFVCHLSEDTNEDDFKLFLRLLFRSGLISRADVVFLFPSSSFSIKFDPLITQEIDSFQRLLDYYYYYYYYMEKQTNSTNLLGFDVARFLRKKDGGDPLWGKKVRAVNHIIINNNNNNNNSGIGLNESEGSNFTESTRPSYGSVVSFEASELDPENSLSGFLDHVPISLRRWACYPMLLGRVKRNFKHVMLVDVRSFFFMGDPLARARNQSPESVYVFGKHDGRTTTTTTSRRNSEKIKSRGRVDSAVLMGGARGVRRLSSSMLIEIARVAMRQQHKRRNSVTELGVLGQLVGNEHVLKNIDFVESAESLPDLSSLVGLTSNSNSSSREFHNQWSIIQRGNGNNIQELNSVIMKRICECEMDSSVYRDC